MARKKNSKKTQSTAAAEAVPVDEIKSKKTVVVNKVTEEKPEAPKPKEKKVIKKKQSNMPKKPLSAYMYFTKDTRPKVKIDHPEFTFGEIGKELGKLWGELEDRKQYQELAQADKLRYQKEKAKK